jgi:sporulation protein YunB
MRYVLLLSLAFFTISTIISIMIIDAGIKPTLMQYAESETKKIAAYVTNQAIEDHVSGDKNSTLDTINPSELARIEAKIENQIISQFKEVETGDITSLEEISNDGMLDGSKKSKEEIFSVPLGKVTDIALLGNLGPDIPVTFQMVGDIESSNIKVKKEEYGINNAFFYIYVQLKIKMQVIIPFASDIITYTRDVPLAMGNYSGDVPQFYNGNGNTTTPVIELPKGSK